MEIKFYIPSYDKNFLTEISKEILKINNGLTVIPNCLGLWFNPDTQKIESDNVTLISVLIEDSKFDNLLNLDIILYRVAQKIIKDLNQSCVLIQINNEPRFYY
jgi:hypothetical protein